ncbi:histidine kinase [Microbacteriaceae bacterium 4G12]
MDLSQYIEDLHRQLAVAADAGGEEARQLAERLAAPLEAATRLVLLDALAAAASEITRDLAPGSVDVRLRGRDPEFVVTLPAADAFADMEDDHRDERSSRPLPSTPVPADADEGSTSRTTLRLPDHLKSRVEDAASREGISVNSWLVRAVGDALETKNRPRKQRDQHDGGSRFTGWVR